MFHRSACGEFFSHLHFGLAVYLVEEHKERTCKHAKSRKQEIDNPRFVLHTARDITCNGSKVFRTALCADGWHLRVSCGVVADDADKQNTQRNRECVGEFVWHRQDCKLRAFGAFARLPFLIVDDVRRHDHRQISVRAVCEAKEELINPDCPNASAEAAVRREHVRKRGYERDRKAVKTCNDEILFLADFLVDDGVENDRNHAWNCRSYADCPTARVAVQRPHSDKWKVDAVTNKNTSCLHRNAETYISAEAENVSAEHYEKHFVVFEFAEHFLETHTCRRVGFDHFLTLEIHQKLEDKSEPRHYTCGDEIFGFADRAAASREYTNETYEYAGGCKRNGFESIAEPCRIVDFFTALWNERKHTLRRNIRHCHAYVPQHDDEDYVNVFACRARERNKHERNHRQNRKRKRREQNPWAHLARLEVGSVDEIADDEVRNDGNKLCCENDARNRHQIGLKNFVEKLRLITVYEPDAEIDAHKT